MKTLPEPDVAARAWPALLAAARLARSAPPQAPRRYAVRDGLAAVPTGAAQLEWDPDTGWIVIAPSSDPSRTLLELYLPLCGPPRTAPFVLGHLGQSLDGCIATASGESHYVTGEANLEHLHRLRALADAVVVGAGTVAADDPQLTTRRVPGASPLRVVVDPRRRLGADHRVFSDGQAATMLVCADDAAGPPRHGNAEVLGLPHSGGVLDRAALLRALSARGCGVVLVEGGGVTVSGFLEAGLLDRLHLAIAPLFIGDGRRGLRGPSGLPLGRCTRPTVELYRMGDDVLYDCNLRA